MIKIRKSEDRGTYKNDWLDSKHSFSFGEYHDPNCMGFESLRVINEDFIAPGSGFATHPHNNMEIISYVLEGGLEHKDSMGNGSVIRPGDVQRMSAGTGVTHSEYNPSKEERGHFLQIWFLPDERGLEPGYEQKAFSDEEKKGRFCLLASKEGRDGSVSLNQDVDMYGALLDSGDSVSYDLSDERALWVQIAKGEVQLNGSRLNAGDGCSIIHEKQLTFNNPNQAEILLFDMKRVIG